MTAREDIRIPFGLAVAMAGQSVSLVDECLDEYETTHRAEVLAGLTTRLRRTPRDHPDYAYLIRAVRIIEGWTADPADAVARSKEQQPASAVSSVAGPDGGTE